MFSFYDLSTNKRFNVESICHMTKEILNNLMEGIE